MSSELPQPNFDPATRYLVRGRDLNAILAGIRARTIIPGPGIETRQTSNGTEVLVEGLAAEGSTTTVGAFYGLVLQSGHTYLQGGSVTGGNGGSASVANTKVLDASTGPIHAAGTILYLQVSATATVEDGVMLPGCSITTASTGTGTSVPNNHAFTTTSKTGNLYLELGRWTADAFLPAAAGNVHAGGCIGNFSLARV